MLIISIILIIVSILLVCVSVNNLHHTHQINEQVDKQNKELEEHNKELNNKKQWLNEQYKNLQQQAENEEKNIERLREVALKATEGQQQLSQRAFENYCQVLEQQYEKEEQDWNSRAQALNTAYQEKTAEAQEEYRLAKEELDKIQATRAAALQAQLKEKEIKEKLAFYCLTISQTNLDDIKVLERMKSQLHNPRILSMLIWQTYFQKPMTALCNNVLGTSVVCGIYKITNQSDDMCYIGQSVDLAKRWKDHAKCGLGVDTPPGNNLYKAMQESGLWNFSFELLEACPRDQLNAKEKYYIELYQSDKFGYNSQAGNNT
jgi:hypothetical protein